MDEFRKSKSGVVPGGSTPTDDLAEYGVWVKAGPEDVLSDEVAGFTDDYNLEDLSEPSAEEENPDSFITDEEEDLLNSLDSTESASELPPEEIADFSFDDFPEEQTIPGMEAMSEDLNEMPVIPEENSDTFMEMELPDISVDLTSEDQKQSKAPEPETQEFSDPEKHEDEDDDAGFEEISLDLGESEINDLDSFEYSETPDSEAPQEPFMSHKDESGKNTGNGDFTEVSVDDFIDFDSLESDEAASKKEEEIATETDSKEAAEENQFLDLDLEMDETISLDSSMDNDKMIDDYLDLDSLPEEPLSGKSGEPASSYKAKNKPLESESTESFPDTDNLEVEEISLDDFGFSNDAAQEFPDSGMESNDDGASESFGFDEQQSTPLQDDTNLDMDLSLDEEIMLPDSHEIELPSSDTSDEITLDSGEMDLSLPDDETFTTTGNLESLDDSLLPEISLNDDDSSASDIGLELNLDDDALVLEEDKALEELSEMDEPVADIQPSLPSHSLESGSNNLSFDDEIENISDEDIDLDNLPDFASFEPEAGSEEVLPTAAESVEELEEMEEIDLGDLDENGLEGELPELEVEEASFGTDDMDTEDLITTPDDESITTADLDEPMFEEEYTPEEPKKKTVAAAPAVDNQMLTQIAQELKSIKLELSSLKSELSTLRAKDAKKTQSVDLEIPQSGDGTEEDETIALTGDELDNILSSADFHEEDGIEEPEAFSNFSLGETTKTAADPLVDPSYLDEVPDISSFDANQIVFEDDDEIDLTLEDLEKPTAPAKKPKSENILPENSVQNEDDMLLGTNLESILTSDEKVFPSSEKGVPESISLTPTGKPAGNLPDNLKGEIKSVIGYLDQLLDSLPKEKIAEFTESEHFVVYKKLFKDLGLG